MAQSTQLKSLMAQNEGMYTGLAKQNIFFIRADPPKSTDDAELIKFYQSEKARLVQAMQEFKKSQPRVEKPKPQPKVEQPKAAEPKPPKDDDDEDVVETKKTYKTFRNMEDLKRAFCNNEYDRFKELCLVQDEGQPYMFYEATYKNSADMDGKPDYVAKNLVTGFVRNLENARPYFFNCFRGYSNDSTNDSSYTYRSLWIVNTDALLAEVTDGCSDDFTFVQIDRNDAEAVQKFLTEFGRSTEPNLIKEAYLH